MTNSQRQHGIASLKPGEKIVGKPGGLVEPGVKQYGFFKKAFKKIKNVGKKVLKSPLGKAALIGGGLYGLGGMQALGGKGIFASGQGLQRFRNLANIGSAARNLWSGSPLGYKTAGDAVAKSGGIRGALGKFGLGKAAFLGAGALATALPFMGGDEEEEVIDDWSVTPSSIKNIHKMAKDRDSSLKFLPSSIYAAPGYYNMAQGGVASLANGGEAGQAQAEQMLRMEYQKYRNQGGTMSYQQFKMAILQQAQGQGPMAQPQMAAYGGRMGYQGGEIVEDASMVEDTPSGLMAENVEEVQGEPSREQLEALAMKIFQLRLEELDEEQLMVVYQAAMQQQPEAVSEDVQFAAAPQEGIMQAANGGRIGYAFGKGPILDPDVQEVPISPFQIQQEEGVPMGLSASNAENESLLETLIEKFMDHPFNLPRKGAIQRALLELEKMSQGGGEEVIEEGIMQAANGGRIGFKDPAGLVNYDLDKLRSNAPNLDEVDIVKPYIQKDYSWLQKIIDARTPPIKPSWLKKKIKKKAGGGRIGAQEGGIMDLGGMEKDYRQEGGFVPLGEEEKADDVPARLSKNEFVFTADAVRAAGGGDIDAGAEVMENVMQNLEEGGKISEESQGEGAQGMFEVSERLSEVM